MASMEEATRKAGNTYCLHIVLQLLNDEFQSPTERAVLLWSQVLVIHKPVLTDPVQDGHRTCEEREERLRKRASGGRTAENDPEGDRAKSKSPNRRKEPQKVKRPEREREIGVLLQSPVPAPKCRG